MSTLQIFKGLLETPPNTLDNWTITREREREKKKATSVVSCPLLWAFSVKARMGSIAKKGLQQYLFQLQQHPLRTKAITAGVLSAISDIVSQKLSGIQKLQLRRLLLKVVFGFAYFGPFGHYLHVLLDKLFRGKKDSKTVAKKVVLEQLTSSPWNNLLFMLYYGLVIEGRPWVNVKAKIKKEYPTVQYTAWTFWPVVGWVNHQYVPLHLRVVFHSLVAFGWGIFLNLRARSLAVTKG